jgi:hypothetical protein
MRIAVAMRSLLRFRYVLVLAVLLVLVAAVAPADAQTLLLTLDTPNPQEGVYFGNSVAVGDVNGDGKGDIAVGAPWENVGGNDYVGRVYVFSGATGARLFTLDMPILQAQADAGFGYSVAMGDVDGDGKADIAVGAPHEDVGGTDSVGQAYVFSGATGLLLFTLDTPHTPHPQVNAYFGNSLTVGDINDDSKADIAVGAYGEDVGGNTDQGRAYVFSGADGSLLRTLDTPHPQEEDRFGEAMAAGDVNGDGKEDVAVGAPREDVGGKAAQGRAYVFSGATGSLLFTLDTPNPQAGAEFGYSVAVGDVNGDGKGDIAVGAFAEDVDTSADQGRAYVFSGATGSLLFTLDTPNPQAQPYFGLGLAVGDVNGDGKAEVAVGAPYEDVDANEDQGRAYVFSGADGSLLFTLDIPLDIPNPQAWSEFGYSLAVGEVNGDGRGEIAVGAAGETVGGNEQAGRAYVFSLASSPSHGAERRAVSHTATPTAEPTAAPPAATPTSEPTPIPAAPGRAEVGPTLKLPSTGIGGESGPSAKGSGWTVGAYAVLAAGTALAVGGWYARRRRLR